jgi:hypothetical protein
MKKAFLFFLLLSSTFCYAQINTDEMQMYQTLFGMPKKEIVAEFVKIDDNKKDLFWKLYDAYESSRKQLGQKRFVVLNNYVKNYTKLNEAETNEIMEDVIELTTSQDKLIAQYYKKIKVQISVVVAAQFYQIEWYLQSQIRTNILEHIPTLEQFENKKK